MILYYPKKTLSYSITGNNCGLDCDFCKQKYLEHMKNPDIEDIDTSKYSSILVSGGFDKNGVLPLPKVSFFKNLFQKNIKINMHLGFFSKDQEDTLSEIGKYVDAFSYNFLPEKKCISHISSDFKKEDYIISYKEFLRLGFNIFPHILLGLTDKSGERQIFDLLSSFSPEKVILLVKIPLDKSELLYPFERLKDCISYIKNVLPTTKIIIGCMRPGGLWRKQNDILAMSCDIHGIVNPAISKDVIAYNEIIEECCVF